MDITFYYNNSERQAINKNLSGGITFSGALRNECSIETPEFMIEAVDPILYNYCYIPSFGRYYFIENVDSVRTNLWRVHCRVDVLMSFKDAILNLNVIISDDTSPDDEQYMSGDVWATTVKTKTDVINFPSGLLDSGEYILITSGGIAS